MSAWNFDISQAPRGHTVDDFVQTPKGVRKTTRFLPVKVILATKCGKVTVSKYMPDEDRWEMLQKGEQPVAWQLWPLHPDFQWFALSQDTHSLPLKPQEAANAGIGAPPPSDAGTNSGDAP
jgi:hypothetical protein